MALQPHRKHDAYFYDDYLPVALGGTPPQHRRGRAPSTTPSPNSQQPSTSTSNQTQHQQQQQQPAAASGTEATGAHAASRSSTRTSMLLEHKSLIRFSDLKIGQMLGAGQFGRVFQARLWGIVVAVKEVLPGADISAQEDAARELAVLQALRHPHVVLLLGHTTRPDNNATMLVMEYMERGSLHSIIHSKSTDNNYHTQCSTPSEVLNVVLQITQGLRYLHEQQPPMFHRDLTSHNVLVDRDGVCKLSDFGLTSIVVASSGEMADVSRYLTNVRWRAPEVKQGTFLAASDIYSLAMICYELFSRVEPWAPDVPLEECFPRACEGKRPIIPQDTPRLWIDIIESAWNQDPNLRPTAKLLMRTFKNLASLSDWLGPAVSDSSTPLSEPGRNTLLATTLTTVLRPESAKKAIAWIHARVSFRIPRGSSYALLCTPKIMKLVVVMIFPDRRSMALSNQSLADDFGGTSWPSLADSVASPLVFTTSEAFVNLPISNTSSNNNPPPPQQQQIPIHALSFFSTVSTSYDEGNGVASSLERCRREVLPLLSQINSWKATFVLVQHGHATESSSRSAGSITVITFFMRDPLLAITSPPKGANHPTTSTSLFHSVVSEMSSVLTTTPMIESFAVQNFLYPQREGVFADGGSCIIA